MCVCVMVPHRPGVHSNQIHLCHVHGCQWLGRHGLPPPTPHRFAVCDIPLTQHPDVYLCSTFIYVLSLILMKSVLPVRVWPCNMPLCNENLAQHNCVTVEQLILKLGVVLFLS